MPDSSSDYWGIMMMDFPGLPCNAIDAITFPMVLWLEVGEKGVGQSGRAVKT
jgi:hypothetical protein